MWQYLPIIISSRDSNTKKSNDRGAASFFVIQTVILKWSKNIDVYHSANDYT